MITPNMCCNRVYVGSWLVSGTHWTSISTTFVGWLELFGKSSMGLGSFNGSQFEDHCLGNSWIYVLLATFFFFICVGTTSLGHNSLSFTSNRVQMERQGACCSGSCRVSLGVNNFLPNCTLFCLFFLFSTLTFLVLFTIPEELVYSSVEGIWGCPC